MIVHTLEFRMYILVSQFNSHNVWYGQESRNSEIKCAGCRQCRHRDLHWDWSSHHRIWRYRWLIGQTLSNYN